MEHGSWFAEKQKAVIKVIKVFSVVKHGRTWVLVCMKTKGNLKSFLSCKKWSNMGLGLQESKRKS